MKKMLDLRYRLLPYIYSEAWQVTKNGSTIMRPLVMDFNGDTSALNQDYEFMFGKALLVAPVTEPKVKGWNVYLPKSVGWYDFWNGEHFNGGQTIKTEVPLDKIPLYVKAGSIIPMGPVIQYATEKNDPIEIRVYPGADGEFTLYEDENDNYDYEKGKYSTITFKWDDANKTLHISDRKGSFPGMVDKHTFNFVLVNKQQGIGIEMSSIKNKTLEYFGKGTTVEF